MSEQTPSEAEGERQEDTAVGDEPETSSGRREVPRTTPSQTEDDDSPTGDEERSEEWERGWSGP